MDARSFKAVDEEVLQLLGMDPDESVEDLEQIERDNLLLKPQHSPFEFCDSNDFIQVEQNVSISSEQTDITYLFDSPTSLNQIALNSDEFIENFDESLFDCFNLGPPMGDDNLFDIQSESAPDELLEKNEFISKPPVDPYELTLNSEQQGTSKGTDLLSVDSDEFFENFDDSLFDCFNNDSPTEGVNLFDVLDEVLQAESNQILSLCDFDKNESLNKIEELQQNVLSVEQSIEDVNPLNISFDQQQSTSNKVSLAEPLKNCNESKQKFPNVKASAVNPFYVPFDPLKGYSKNNEPLGILQSQLLKNRSDSLPKSLNAKSPECSVASLNVPFDSQQDFLNSDKPLSTLQSQMLKNNSQSKSLSLNLSGSSSAPLIASFDTQKGLSKGKKPSNKLQNQLKQNDGKLGQKFLCLKPTKSNAAPLIVPLVPQKGKKPLGILQNQLPKSCGKPGQRFLCLKPTTSSVVPFIVPLIPQEGSLKGKKSLDLLQNQQQKNCGKLEQNSLSVNPSGSNVVPFIVPLVPQKGKKPLNLNSRKLLKSRGDSPKNPKKAKTSSANRFKVPSNPRQGTSKIKKHQKLKKLHQNQLLKNCDDDSQQKSLSVKSTGSSAAPLILSLDPQQGLSNSQEPLELNSDKFWKNRGDSSINVKTTDVNSLNVAFEHQQDSSKTKEPLGLYQSQPLKNCDGDSQQKSLSVKSTGSSASPLILSLDPKQGSSSSQEPLDLYQNQPLATNSETHQKYSNVKQLSVDPLNVSFDLQQCSSNGTIQESLEPNEPMDTTKKASPITPSLMIEYGDPLDVPCEIPRKKFQRHFCSRECIKMFDELPPSVVSNQHKINILLLPFYYGFRRIFVIFTNTNEIVYMSPCGKILSLPSHIKKYLSIVLDDDFPLDINYFTFSPNLDLQKISCQPLQYVEDCTNGLETRPISMINFLDDCIPRFKLDFEYTKDQVYPDILGLNIEKIKKNPIVKCDDQCNNCEECVCQKMTKKGSRSDKFSGYSNKRLFQKREGVIYECHDGCKCGKRCPNRLVQNGTPSNLQMFQDNDNCWGVRTLSFIPQGTFVTCYHTVLTAKFTVDGNLQNGIDNQNNLTPNEPKSNGKIEFYLHDDKLGCNIGPYIKTSREPNLFFQHVFIDIQEPKVPLIALFAMRDILPFEELFLEQAILNSLQSDGSPEDKAGADNATGGDNLIPSCST